MLTSPVQIIHTLTNNSSLYAENIQLLLRQLYKVGQLINNPPPWNYHKHCLTIAVYILHKTGNQGCGKFVIRHLKPDTFANVCSYVCSNQNKTFETNQILGVSNLFLRQPIFNPVNAFLYRIEANITWMQTTVSRSSLELFTSGWEYSQLTWDATNRYSFLAIPVLSNKVYLVVSSFSRK